MFTFTCLLAYEKPDYADIRKHYEDLEKNDIRALPYVNQYIRKAKNEANFAKLVQGYRDAVLFTPSEQKKLVYADSTIYAALRSGDNDLISIAYLGKGIIYYFNFIKFKPALDEYVKAYQYSKNTKDEYLKHKILYHLGVVKNYLGYYKEAIEHFNDCIAFFEQKTKDPLHPNEIYNNKRGYLNSLHQISVCYKNDEQYSRSDSIVNIGLSKANESNDFLLEKSYFLKSKGILNFYHDNYDGAILYLNQSLPAIIRVGDFEWVSIIYFYLGRSQMKNNQEKAIKSFQKVDSIFNKHHFVVPRIRSNYEFLIDYYKKKKNIDKELYYTKQLLKADSLISKDFTYLSSKIHKEYDRQSLLDEKEYLEQTNFNRMVLTIIFCILAFIFLLLFILHYRKERNIRIKYKALQDKFDSADWVNKAQTESVILSIEPKKMILTPEISHELFEKLSSFEKNHEFTQKGLTQNKLASMLKTNTYYISTFINETKGMNFNRYIGELRINYITELLYSNQKYLNYTIDALADECGISTRQSFSDLFFEINGIRPKDFIRKRKEEVGSD
ncbi:AraC family transcriptional regulator [Chryseobacterium sp. RP-3-3]|uniref:AraC family transcriptional regulator n=1 Tax=Chryseobacterium antibioticum TaxID=2728847 RepID=A0A7Y0ANV1_9FLAO|nr:helix-turn-helix domain-containing protein [Chryseobacterium antibioticum]NML70776.1 AraC family transcriptional regulator [Chryseobacterium antibioticum]